MWLIRIFNIFGKKEHNSENSIKIMSTWAASGCFVPLKIESKAFVFGFNMLLANCNIIQ